MTTSDMGQITLDGLLITYLGAPLGCAGSSTYTLSKNHASTTRVSVTDGSGIQITSGVSGGVKVGGGSVSFGNTATYTQSASTQVTNGIVLQRTTSEQTPTPAPGVIGNTVFLGLYRPTFEIAGPPSGAVFKLLKADLEFVLRESTLVDDRSAGALFKPSTTQSFLDQYLPIKDPTGTNLVKPRFKLKFAVLLDAGINQIFTFSKGTTASSSITNTTATSASIVASSGFSLGIFRSSFSIGKTLSVQNVQSYETSTTKIVSLSTALNRTARGISAVYFDRIFKTFVVVDQGAPGVTVAQGKVTDAAGSPIPGAAVTVVQGGTNYVTLTDAAGTYALAAPRTSPLTAGTAQITCGGMSRAITIGATPALANLGGVNLTTATERSFEDLAE